MFDANDSLIRLSIHSKTEMSHAIIQAIEYSQEYFQPNIGRKIRVHSAWAGKTIFL